MKPPTFTCPRCKRQFPGPFGYTCPDPACGFNLDDLTGQSTKQWIVRKDQKHRELLTSGTVTLFGDYNASFDYNGDAKLTDLVRFTLTFGDWAKVPAGRGRFTNDVIISFVPEVIGSGTSIFQPGLVPCSGVCLMSPGSLNWGHSYPALDSYVQNIFGHLPSRCKLCGAATGFAMPVCDACYRKNSFDWLALL
jgi:hypothetical protein